jgi:YgiT-type zinc finger domain-containing protein
MVTSLFEHKVYPCPYCHVGNLHSKLAFYCAWHEGRFISAPDFPAWVCDVCGHREYDREAVFELDTILQMDRDRRQKARYNRRQLKRPFQPAKFNNSGRSH